MAIDPATVSLAQEESKGFSTSVGASADFGEVGTSALSEVKGSRGWEVCGVSSTSEVDLASTELGAHMEDS